MYMGVYGAQLHILMCVCICVCVSTGGPAPPRSSSSAPPVSAPWWPWWGRPSLPRPRAPGWRRGRECPPAPSFSPDTASQTPPPTPRAEAASCVDRKQEGNSSAVVSVVMFGTHDLWWNPVDALQQWFVYFVVVIRETIMGLYSICLFKGTIHQSIRQASGFVDMKTCITTDNITNTLNWNTAGHAVLSEMLSSHVCGQEKLVFSCSHHCFNFTTIYCAAHINASPPETSASVWYVFLLSLSCLGSVRPDEYKN